MALNQDIAQDQHLYINAWEDTMLMIWREKIERMNIVRSGALHQSFTSSSTFAPESSEIKMKFLKYGIYQALGVGNGYAHDNGGDLHFLDKEYRQVHGLDKPKKVGPAWGGYVSSGLPRKKRDWFSKKLYSSHQVLKEAMAKITGEQAVQIICDALDDTRQTL